MSKPADLVGQRFGRMVVMAKVGMPPGSGALWLARCDCGEERELATSKVKARTSCGCQRREVMARQAQACKVVVVDGKKRCPGCERMLSVDLFGVTNKKRAPHGLQSRCAECRREDYYLTNYGLTLAQVASMKAAGCACCRSLDDLHIDHDHQTGEIRGVLCGGCNRALGMIGDDPQRLLSLMYYLMRHNHPKEFAA